MNNNYKFEIRDSPAITNMFKKPIFSYRNGSLWVCQHFYFQSPTKLFIICLNWLTIDTMKYLKQTVNFSNMSLKKILEAWCTEFALGVGGSVQLSLCLLTVQKPHHHSHQRGRPRPPGQGSAIDRPHRERPCPPAGAPQPGSLSLLIWGHQSWGSAINCPKEVGPAHPTRAPR